MIRIKKYGAKKLKGKPGDKKKEKEIVTHEKCGRHAHEKESRCNILKQA